jgi:L,D-transpeptidase YcbB
VRNPFLAAVAALSLITMAPACSGNQTLGSDPAMVDPKRVTPAALQAAASEPRVRAFYEAREWEPLWTRDAARALVGAIEEAPRHALDPREYLVGPEEAQSAAGREAALTLSALDYADALARGRVDPGALRSVYTLDRPDPDIAAGLARAVAEDDVAAWLASLAPQDAEYRALSEAYLQYRTEAQPGRTPGIGGGDSIEQGDRDPRVPRIVEALLADGYLEEAPEGEPEVYTTVIAAAVAQLQADYGIESDGIVGPETLAMMNTGAADRARTLAVNLERRRWLARDVPPTRIDVNTAAAVLDYWHEGSRADHRRVVVGQPGWETPQLGSPLFRLVANPSWTVPRSIEREEIAPQGEGYLARNNMVRRDGWIVQLPGPTNALGQVKFDMRNDHAIYLHDTPAKALFARNQRHFSHGCVRVQDALGFARMLADRHGRRAEFERALATGRETFVDLEREIPVRLLYHTAFVDRAGNVVFRSDPYGWDARVAEALGREARQARQLRRQATDIGP